jgi:1-acyl-sn-glycerol-3-phosphate acyltransferase
MNAKADAALYFPEQKSLALRVGRFFLGAVMFTLLRIFSRLEVLGLENVPASGPAIVIYNHITFLDPLIATGVLPRPSMAMSKQENLDHPVIGFILRCYGTFPVKRGRGDRTALRTSLRLLDRGNLVLVAPEGTRSSVPGLLEGKDGMTYLALQANVPIIAVGVSGSERMIGNLKRFRRTPVRLSVSRPFRLAPRWKKVRRPELHQLTHAAMGVLAQELPLDYRGYYHDAAPPDQDPLIRFE